MERSNVAAGHPGFLGVILIVLWIYCIFVVIATDAILVRNLPKPAWLFIVFFIPDIGSVAWLALGRADGPLSTTRVVP